MVRLKTTCVVMAVGLFMSVATVEAQGRWRPGDTGSFRVFLGQNHFQGESRYWNEKFMDFTGEIGDFDDMSFTMDYRIPLNHTTAVLVGGSWNEGKTTQAYREWVDADGRDIWHRTRVQSFDFSVMFIAELNRGTDLTPYLGAGGGYLTWDLAERGNFIDFDDPDLPIVEGWYTDSSSTWEWVAVVGLDYRIAEAFSVLAEARWRDADDELGGAFAGFGTLDLSGYSYQIGFAYHF